MKKVAIVGGGPRGIHAPWDDESYDKWVLGNQMDRWDPNKVSRIFEIHENLSEHPSIYPVWLTDFGIPMVVNDGFPHCPEHVQHFDHNAVPIQLRGQLASSPAYMMAQAIHDGYDVIELWGIDLGISDHEYFMQRPSMYAWIGYALGLGIVVKPDPESPLFHDTYDEGRDWGKHEWIVPRSSEDSKFAMPPFTAAQFKEMSERHALRAMQCEADYRVSGSEKSAADFQAHGGAKQVYDKLSQVSRAIESGQIIKKLSDAIVTK